ncbi:MAG: hypothetical protein A4E66_02373 [Syntrophus sp. PtaB.Bin001]|nr:MAG: hypothetical protein A4E66_02373 [Syntrophus sp. PtaB.Bin001]
MLDLRVVTTDNSDRPFYLSRFDRIDERGKGPAQCPNDGFDGESGHAPDRAGRNQNPFPVTAHKVFHRFPDYLECLFPGILGGELHMLHEVEFCLVGSRIHLCVVALGDLSQGWHDALVIDDDGFRRPGYDDQLRHQVIAGHGNLFTHHYFISRATQPRQIDARGSLRFRQRQHIVVFDGETYHFGNDGAVPMHQYIDLILLEHAQVYFRKTRRRGAENDV